jgi:hypothetical protein
MLANKRKTAVDDGISKVDGAGVGEGWEGVDGADVSEGGGEVGVSTVEVNGI